MITDVQTYKVFFLGMFISAACFSISTLHEGLLFGNILIGIAIVFFTISILVFLKPKVFTPFLIKILDKIYSISGKRNVESRDGILRRTSKDEQFYRR